MKPFLYIFSFCFIRYEVGMLNPFYLVLVLFVLYVTRWVCATLLIFFCFVLYVTVWVCLTLYIVFSFWFYMLPGGYVKPFSCTFIFGFICYIEGM